jgi:hypothetical protein
MGAVAGDGLPVPTEEGVMDSFLVAVGVTALVGVIVAWIRSAMRHAGAARSDAAGDAAGSGAALYTAGLSSSSPDCSPVSGADAGYGDGGAG